MYDHSNKITIAIDGFSSCGKSTLAKAMAKELNYIFVDSGAMYRAVTLFAFQNQLIEDDKINVEKLIQSLPNIEIHFMQNELDHSQAVFLNGIDVSDEIRTMYVSNFVSPVAAIKEVRVKLVEAQREFGKEGGVIMDGRDIGSVVFPFAELKLFITADPEIRAKRRFDELTNKGESPSLDDVKTNLSKRDYIDSTREESPLIQVYDAVVIDNSNLSQEEQLTLALAHVKSRKLELAN